MGELSPLLFVIIIYLCFIYPLVKAKKKGAGNARKGPAQRKSPDTATAEAGKTGSQKEMKPRMHDTFTRNEELYRGSLNAETGEGMEACHDREVFRGSLNAETSEGMDPCHDREVFRGSLNVETGEGMDPCHDEQMKSLRPGPAPAMRGEPEGGLKLSWTGDEIVRGFVMSEVLKRKQ